MFATRLQRWGLPLMFALFFQDEALAWQGRPFASGGSGFCPFFDGWAGGWPGMLMSILFWVLICLAIVHLIRRLFYNTKIERPPVDAESRPLDILRSRYARGEITVEEFQQMKKDLL